VNLKDLKKKNSSINLITRTMKNNNPGYRRDFLQKMPALSAAAGSYPCLNALLY